MVKKRVYDSIRFVGVDDYEKVRRNNTAAGTVQDNGSGDSDDGNERRYYLGNLSAQRLSYRPLVFVGAMSLDVLGVLSADDLPQYLENRQ